MLKNVNPSPQTHNYNLHWQMVEYGGSNLESCHLAGVYVSNFLAAECREVSQLVQTGQLI